MAAPAVLFDLNGTLLDPAGMAPALRGVADAEELCRRALEDAILQAIVDTVVGVFRPLPDLLDAALARRLELEGGTGLGEAMQRARALPPFPDATPAVAILRNAGLAVGVLTNSATEAAESALSAAGLSDGLEVVVSVEAVGAYKPDPRVYRAGVERLGRPADEVVLVAAHWWDVQGARRAGLQGGWVARRERVLPATVDEPEFRGVDLVEVAEAIAHAPR